MQAHSSSTEGAIARLPMENSLLHVKASTDPERRTDQDEVYWRCATGSIWEGRLAATRWLIEFIRIKRHSNSKAIEHTKQKAKDVRIDDLDGGKLFDLSDPNAQLLADVWKGCSQASTHATNEYNHPAVSDRKELPAALTIVVNHLQDTIYSRASKQIGDCVLKSKD